MKNYILLFVFIFSFNSNAQELKVAELKPTKKETIESYQRIASLNHSSCSTFTIHANCSAQELREIENAAKKIGIDLKVREVIKSNKILELYLDYDQNGKAIVEHFENGNFPIDKITLMLKHKNDNILENNIEKKSELILQKDKNNKETGNIPRILVSL